MKIVVSPGKREVKITEKREGPMSKEKTELDQEAQGALCQVQRRQCLLSTPCSVLILAGCSSGLQLPMGTGVI